MAGEPLANFSLETTMSNEFLGDRRVALEEAFFSKENERLRQRLRDMGQARQHKEALSAASGITDDAVLDRLAALNIGGDTLAALALVPLVAIAWADGDVDDKERHVLLAKASEMGLGKQDVSYQLFERWLAAPPAATLLAAWKDYIGAFAASLDPRDRRALRQELLNRAHAVAEAAGGFLGFAGVSPSEAKVLKELEQSFPG
jgi:DnaJ-domain-containing protein 1